MMESDADRLESIKALGGQLVPSDQGEFWGIFDTEFQVALDGAIESLGPAISSCLTSDVKRLQLRKDSAVTVDGVTYKVRRVEQTDVPGLSTLLLSL
jgi:hypothetical protein